MIDKNIFYSLGRRDEMAAFCALVRFGGIKYALKSLCDRYIELYKDEENPHVKYVLENINNLKM